MSRPIAIFGLPQEKYVKKIFALRQKLFSEGKMEEAELFTLPHLTILINSNLDDLVSNEFLIQKLKPFLNVIRQFNIPITEVEKFDNSIIAKFDNSFTRKLVSQMSSVLPGFRAITTDYIKVLRKVVPEHLDQVLEDTKKELETEIVIDRVAMAGGTLRKEDLLWSAELLPKISK